jgi:hypothetical protein
MQDRQPSLTFGIEPPGSEAWQPTLRRLFPVIAIDVQELGDRRLIPVR